MQSSEDRRKLYARISAKGVRTDVGGLGSSWQEASINISEELFTFSRLIHQLTCCGTSNNFGPMLSSSHVLEAVRAASLGSGTSGGVLFKGFMLAVVSPDTED